MHIIWILLILVSGYLCVVLANAKGRSAKFWGFLGALLGPFALWVLLFLKSKKG